MLTALAKNRTSTPKPTLLPTKATGQVTQASLSRTLETLVTIPSVIAKVKMYCRTGFYLVVLPDGHVRGTRNDTEANIYGRFELQSFALRIIRMKNLATNRYVGINSKGKVFSTVSIFL